MGKTLQVMVAAFFVVQPMVGMARSKDERIRESVGASTIWKMPSGPITHDWLEMIAIQNLRTITANEACHGAITSTPNTAYVLTFQEKSLSEAARNLLIEKMSVPAICETGFSEREECFSFGEALAKAAIADTKDIAVRVSCRRASDNDEKAADIGSNKDHRDNPNAFRFSGGSHF